MAKEYKDSMRSLASPRDLEYWQKQLGLKPTATPGFYYDDEGNYGKIFGGEDTYKFDLDPRTSVTDSDYALENLKKSKKDKETDSSLIEEINEAMSNLQKEAAATGIKVEDADIKPYKYYFPFDASSDLVDAMGPTPHYWMSHSSKHDLYRNPDNPDAWPSGTTVSVPTFPNLFNWGVNVEEITGHGDRRKITNDPYLPHALWANMYYPGHFKDDYVPEYNWDRKLSGERTYVQPENRTPMEITFPESYFPAYKESNYIANKEMADLQGLGTTGFHIEKEYPSRFLEEMYSKDLVEEDVPLHSWAKDLFDHSRMSYSRPLFNHIKELENDYSRYLAMTGPLRDRSTPIWESEVKNPLFKFRYNPKSYEDEVFDLTDLLSSNKKSHPGKGLISAGVAPWNKIDWLMNPFPEYSRFGGPGKFLSEFLKPMSHKRWFAGDKAGSKHQSLEDQKQAELGNIVSHVNPINKHQLYPYYQDYTNFSDYAQLPNRSGLPFSGTGDEVEDYLNDPTINAYIEKLNKK